MSTNQKGNNTEISAGERIMKYIALFGGIQCASLLVGLVINKVASEFLGRIGVGLIATYNRTTRMLGDCTNLSLSFSAVRQISEIYNSGDKKLLSYWIKVLRSWTFITTIAGVLFTLVACLFISDWMFGGQEYDIWYVLMLALTVGSMAISGSELALLKAVQRLNDVAVCSFISISFGLLFSLPLYIFVGLSGILPAIFLVSVSQMIMYLCYTVPKYSYKIDIFSSKVLKDGLGMVKLGVGYIFAAILGSGSIWLVYELLRELGGGDIVGLFSCGYFLMGVLPGVLFASIDSDYYPRLSAVNRDTLLANKMVNEQIEIHLLLQTPLLLCFILLIPLFLPLLYDVTFMDALPMIQIAMLAMLVRTLNLPIGYISLSKGDSRTFLLQEAIYDILFVVFVVAGYHLYGIEGLGWAIVLAYLLELFVILWFAASKYKFYIAKGNIKNFVIQGSIMVLAVVAAIYFKSGILYWGAGALCILSSSLFSLMELRRRVTIMDRVRRILNKFISKR